MKPSSRLIPLVVAGAAVLAGCGATDGTDASASGATDVVESTVDTSGASGDSTAGAEQPASDQLAMTDDADADHSMADDADTDQSMADDADPGQSMADDADGAVGAAGGLEDSLAAIEQCLVDAGVEGADFTLPTLMAKAQEDFPADADLTEVFGFFLDRDPSDPAFTAAVAACQDLVYADPMVASFMPPPPAG